MPNDFIEIDNEFPDKEAYELFLGRVVRSKQQIGEDTDKKRLVVDIELGVGGYLNNVPYYGGGIDLETEYPHGLFIPPRENQLIGILFLRGNSENPVGCFPLPHPSWEVEEKDDYKYNEILEDLEDIALFHFSGTRVLLKKDGKVEIGKKDGSTYRRLEIDFQTGKIVIDTPNNESIEFGENIAKQLVNNLPNCIYSGAQHTIGNTKVKV